MRRTTIFALAIAVSACSSGATEETARAPELSLLQTAPRTVDLRIAGPDGLRALQGVIVYEMAQVRVTRIETGSAAVGLDRVFFADPVKASGRIVFGLTDTRRVQLPARGALLRLTLAPVGNANGARLTVEQALGVRDEMQRVDLARVQKKVGLP